MCKWKVAAIVVANQITNSQSADKKTSRNQNSRIQSQTKAVYKNSTISAASLAGSAVSYQQPPARWPVEWSNVQVQTHVMQFFQTHDVKDLVLSNSVSTTSIYGNHAKLNYRNTAKHVLDEERNNRLIQERTCATFHRLLYTPLLK